MMEPAKAIRTAQVLLTISCAEFFGPAIRDTGVSHLLNPAWVGHARVHLAWLLGFMVCSGVCNLYFIWRRRTPKVPDLKLSCLWQGCNIVGFWIAVAFVGAYEGAMIDPLYHMHIFGIEENTFAFSVLTAILVAAIALVYSASKHEAQAG
jgi:hypothetical protein